MPEFNDIEKFIDIRVAVPALKGTGWRQFLRRKIEYICGITGVRKIVVDAAKSESTNVFTRFLEILDIVVDDRGVKEMIHSIPSDSGMVIIANHPYGGADAMSLSSIAVQCRPDNTKILANSLVHHAPKFIDYLLPLKILGEPDAPRHNLRTLKSASEHVKAGGLLVVFPAGGVSHYQSEHGKITDGPWSEHIARIAIKAKVPVLPVKYFGQNKIWYQVLGKINPLFRAALIPRALLLMQHQTIKCRAGSIIDPLTLAAAENPTEFLRDRVYEITDTIEQPSNI